MKNMSSLFGRPAFLKAFHGWCTFFWVPFTVLAGVIGWVHSTTFISYMSMVALFLGSFSAWQASRVEVVQDQQIDDATK